MSLRKSFFWIASSRASYAAAQWLTTIVVARVAGPQQFGEFAYALAVTSPVIIFAQMNLRGYLATDVGKEFDFDAYWTTQLFMLLGAALAIAAVALTNGHDKSVALLLAVTGAYKAVEAMSGLYYGALQRQERMRAVSISVAAHGVLAFAAMSVVVTLSGSVVLGSFATLASWLMLLIGFDARVVRHSEKFARKARVDWNVVWRVIKACLPLGIVLALASLRINVPVYFLKSEHGVVAVAGYSAAAYFFVAGNMIVASLLEVAAPRLASFATQNQRFGFQRLVMRLAGIVVAIGATGVVIVWWFGEVLLTLMYGASYVSYKDALIWVMAAAAAMYVSQLCGVALTATRNFRQQVVANSGGVIAGAVLSMILVPYWEASGAGAALFGGAFITMLINARSVLQRYRAGRSGVSRPREMAAVATSAATSD